MLMRRGTLLLAPPWFSHLYFLSPPFLAPSFAVLARRHAHRIPLPRSFFSVSRSPFERGTVTRADRLAYRRISSRTHPHPPNTSSDEARASPVQRSGHSIKASTTRFRCPYLRHRFEISFSSTVVLGVLEDSDTRLNLLACAARRSPFGFRFREATPDSIRTLRFHHGRAGDNRLREHAPAARVRRGRKSGVSGGGTRALDHRVDAAFRLCTDSSHYCTAL